MKNFYSILSIPINSILDERISIGIIMSDGKSHYFKYSLSKLQYIKPLISNESFSLLRSYLKSIEKETELINQDSYNEDSNWLNESYISYLSKYSNNLLNFSTVKYIDLEISNELFNVFFSKYIFSEPQHIIAEKTNIVNSVKSTLNPKIKNNVNIDYCLTPDKLPNLYMSIDVDFIGKNGIPVSGQILDLSKKIHFLESDLSKYISLTKALDLEYQNNGKYFVIGQEPDRKLDGKNHDLWETLRSAKYLDYVEMDEVDKISDYITSNNVKPLFEEVKSE